MEGKLERFEEVFRAARRELGRSVSVYVMSRGYFVYQ